MFSRLMCRSARRRHVRPPAVCAAALLLVGGGGGVRAMYVAADRLNEADLAQLTRSVDERAAAGQELRWHVDEMPDVLRRCISVATDGWPSEQQIHLDHPPITIVCTRTSVPLIAPLPPPLSAAQPPQQSELGVVVVVTADDAPASVDNSAVMRDVSLVD